MTATHAANLAAVLKAILDNPEDDFPRLAYADLCEEAGDEARAEFIRAQIELLRLSRSAREHYPAEWLHMDGLRDRLRRLTDMDGMLAAWCVRDGLPVPRPDDWSWSGTEEDTTLDFYPAVEQRQMLPEVSYVWGRGFVHAVNCNAAVWLAHADAITAAHPVREVVLTTHPGDAAIQDLFRHRWKNTDPQAVTVGWTWGEILRAEWPGITFTLPK